MNKGAYSQKTVTYDLSDMEKKVKLQDIFANGTSLCLVELRDRKQRWYKEWQVNQSKGVSSVELTHVGSISIALQFFNRKILELSYRFEEDAHEGWFLPTIDAILEVGFDGIEKDPSFGHIGRQTEDVE